MADEDDPELEVFELEEGEPDPWEGPEPAGETPSAGAAELSNAAEPSGAADPSGAESSSADPLGAEPSGADPSGADPSGADPSAAQVFGAPPGSSAPEVRQGPGLAGELRALALVARDGVLCVAAALAVSLAGLTAIVYTVATRVTVPFSDFYTWAAWLTGASFGTPVHYAFSGDVGLGDANGQSGSGSSGLGPSLPSLNFADGLELRLTVWMLTLLAVVLAFLLSRRAEGRTGSGQPWRVVLRACGSGVFAALVVLLLAETSNGSQLTSPSGSPLLSSLISIPGETGHGAAGLTAVYAFLGTLLIVFTASLLGRLGVWIRIPHHGRRSERARIELARWAPAARTAWLQARIVGLLAGLSLLIYVIVEADGNQSTSAHLFPIVLGGILLFGNLAVYGALGGFGATLYASIAMSYSVPGLGQIADDTAMNSDGSAAPSRTLEGLSAGLFGEHRPWIVWVLLAVAILGTAAPVLLARRTRRFAVRAEDVPLLGVWRPAVLGAAAAAAAVLLGRLSATMSTSFGGAGATGTGSETGSVGPSLLASIGLTALWFCAGYLAISLAAGNRPSRGGGARLGLAVEAQAEAEIEAGSAGGSGPEFDVEAQAAADFRDGETLGDAAPIIAG